MSIDPLDPLGTEFFDPKQVRRAKDGRPYIKLPCPASRGEALSGSEPMCVEGRIPSEKRPGKTVQCPKCKGAGHVEKLYTRCTTFVGALEERTALEAWKQRVILTGIIADPLLRAELGELNIDEIDRAFAEGDDPLAESSRQLLSRLAQRAFEIGDGHAAAQKGTDLHALSEYVDRGEPLPAKIRQEIGGPREVTLQDRADLAAWQRVKEDLGIEVLESELFVVNDDFAVAGTLDRLVLTGTQWCPVHCQRPAILDIKSGRVDYGQGKMCQQLAMYANSSRYDHETGERTDLGACKHVGLIVNLRQGTGDAKPLLADLVEGYAAVELSRQVREHRSISKKWITELPQN